ncbi:MAG: hypothetical protein MUE47_04500 [Acidobacteria bacterium]|jgi:hypothetical protein|nr:hypothetical protein [Acidobacteriota bacterium]
MKSTLFALLTLASGAALAAPPVAPGDYRGTGRYLAPDGSVGTYEIEARVEGDRLTTRYAYKDQAGNAQQRSMTVQFGADGSIAVTSPDQPGAIAGRCDAALCSYASSFPGGQVMELLRFGPDGIEKVGSKSFSGASVAWTESLSRVK